MIPRLLVIDDEPVLRTLVADVSERLGFEVFQASTLAEGLSIGQHGIDVVVLDKKLPDGDGVARIKEIVGLPGWPNVLVITGHDDGDAAETALRSGAWEFLPKPFGPQKLLQILRQTMALRTSSNLKRKSVQLDRSRVIGSSDALNIVFSRIYDAANSDVNVLLLGETGVGKELFAQTLYQNSLRSQGPFVAVDCASLPKNLLESHLFGHARGAFTGADRAKDGLLLTANEGTLFLDEVGELPLSMQKSFLRALELRCFRPVGSVNEISSNFRLVAATNKDLVQLVKEGLFREDLLYRLQGMTIRIPPLRERKDDIVPLAIYAIDHFCRKYQMPSKTMEAHFVEAILSYSWPGNVRELMHCIERVCVTAKNDDELFTIHLPTDMRISIARSAHKDNIKVKKQSVIIPNTFNDEKTIIPDILNAPLHTAKLPSLKDWKMQSEYNYMKQVIKQGDGDVRKCANIAGVSRGHFYELLKKHKISLP